MSIYYIVDNNKKIEFVDVVSFEKGYKDTINVSIKEIRYKIEIITK